MKATSISTIMTFSRTFSRAKATPLNNDSNIIITARITGFLIKIALHSRSPLSLNIKRYY